MNPFSQSLILHTTTDATQNLKGISLKFQP